MCILYNFGAYSQSKKAITTKLDQPKLVVGIVVDQMRYDFLYRYYDRLSENGFKRLINGAICCPGEERGRQRALFERQAGGQCRSRCRAPVEAREFDQAVEQGVVVEDVLTHARIACF